MGVQDLDQRLTFIRNWCDNGTPIGFWISCFFFPQAFLTGTMQNFARKYQEPIDTISFSFKYRDDLQRDGSDISERPQDGAFIHGLYLEGARWSDESHVLADSRPKELYTLLPVLHLL